MHQTIAVRIAAQNACFRESDKAIDCLFCCNGRDGLDVLSTVYGFQWPICNTVLDDKIYNVNCHSNCELLHLRVLAELFLSYSIVTAAGLATDFARSPFTGCRFHFSLPWPVKCMLDITGVLKIENSMDCILFGRILVESQFSSL